MLPLGHPYRHCGNRVSAIGSMMRVMLTISNVIAATTKTIAPRYLALFLLLGGIYGSFNVCHAWTGSLMARPRAKRAMSYAIVNAVANRKSLP